MTFKEIYEIRKAARAEYKVAWDAKDEAEMDRIRGKVRALDAEIEAQDAAFARLYSRMEESLDRGNEYIDIDDVIWDDQVADFVDTLRKYGIEKFTFSSGWTKAVETAWLFQQNGCKLEGLVEINGHEKAYGEAGYDKRHGYLFSVK